MPDTSSSSHHLPYRYAENGDAFPGWPGHGQTCQSIGRPLQHPQDGTGEPNTAVQVISQGSDAPKPQKRAQGRKRKSQQ